MWFWAGLGAQPCRNQAPIYFGLISAQFPFGPGLDCSNKNSSKIISKNMWFSVILLLYFDQYRFVFLYCKDTNPVLKYPVFVKFSKNVLFSCIRPSLSNIYIYKYYNIIFSHNKGNFKTIYVWACILAFITSLFKPWELGQYFKNSKKIFLSSFSIWDYEFIRKTYSRY